MKIRSIKEVEIKSPRITIRLDPENEGYSMYMEYTCQDCAGYGCRSHGGSGGNPDCRMGTVHFTLDPKTLDTVFDEGFLAKIRSTLHKLFMAITK